MTDTVIPHDQVERHFADATKAAKSGSVIITTNGSPSHVLMTFEAYQRLVQNTRSIADLFYYPGAADIEFEPKRLETRTKTGDLE
ncbi:MULTISPECIES: type II toxin-antitoxin system Phd/YefM family antitoxin [Thalassospira]|uniref:Antitoxin n=2 Tax=Thalassospira TaxID=168934 RepID=A0A367VXD4_9PROT|nr:MULTISPECIES: type II toxin-antitoxin system Phd/YefM family antitoxin [Thalassospira]MDG4717815.1 type II toxin-antitoxin system Phd/YefM family antitoxin [Thalassospira sp. FZY0004]RCK30333.1 hypothetical protein TH19_22565 [Thalassospira profundimaris]